MSFNSSPTKRVVEGSGVIFKETTWNVGLGAGGRNKGCNVSECSMALLTLREETAKAGAGVGGTLPPGVIVPK